MLRNLLAFIVMMMASSQAMATPIIRVEVIGIRINGTVLCSGEGCRGIFDAPDLVNWQGQFQEISDEAPQDEPPVCSGDAETRELAISYAYQTDMIARHGGLFQAITADAENRATGPFYITVELQDGSTGRYRRSDSAFTSSHLFHEEQRPACAG